MRGRKPGLSSLADAAPLVSSLPEPPAGLLDGEGLAEWQRLVDLLGPLGILDRLDRAALAAYAAAWSRWKKAEAALQKEGEVIATAQGMVANPWNRIAKEAFAVMVKLLGEFGLSPTARLRLLALREEPDDDHVDVDDDE